MSATTVDCLYCHSKLPDRLSLDQDHPYVCDLCMEKIRTHQPLDRPPGAVPTQPQSDERKSSKPKGRKIKAVATVLVFMLLPFTGCAVNWSGRVELALDPTPLLTLQRPLPAPGPGPAIVPPTEP